MSPNLLEIYRRLQSAFGPQHWWPGESRWEVIVGAVLTQNTAWNNVEKALQNLRAAQALTPQSLAALSEQQLSELIRPAGYYRVKARRLRHFVQFLFESYSGSLDALFAVELTSLRRQLLSIHGIGPETADSILLYAGQQPTFVVDAYTARVLQRHGWVPHGAKYALIKHFFESQLEPQVVLFNEYHALLVRLGKEFCRSQPLCSECPLQELLPDRRPTRAGASGRDLPRRSPDCAASVGLAPPASGWFKPAGTARTMNGVNRSEDARSW